MESPRPPLSMRRRGRERAGKSASRASARPTTVPFLCGCVDDVFEAEHDYHSAHPRWMTAGGIKVVSYSWLVRTQPFRASWACKDRRYL